MKYWKVHQNIFFTKGFNRTLVLDSLKETIKFIPNELYDKLLEKEFIINRDDMDIEYFHYLESNNYIFSDKKKKLKRFIEISRDFSISYEIGVCVIELSDITGKNLFKLIEPNNISTRINQYNFIFGEFTNEKSILNFIDFVQITARTASGVNVNPIFSNQCGSPTDEFGTNTIKGNISSCKLICHRLCKTYHPCLGSYIVCLPRVTCNTYYRCYIYNPTKFLL
jgi:hypothetical protein